MPTPKSSTSILKHHDEFVRILDDYSINESGKQILDRTKLVLMVAPTSSGRNAIIRKLLGTGHYFFIVSDTTRPPRENDGVMEQSGVEYNFRTEEEVLDDLNSGWFLEAAIIHGQQVSGISIDEIKKAQQQGKIGITDIEIVGADCIIKAKPDATAVFLLPPDFDEWMRRLKHRGRMSEKEKQRRLFSAEQEIETALNRNYYTFVVNDNIDESADYIDRIARLGKHDPEHNKQARKVAQQLLEQAKQSLSSKT